MQARKRIWETAAAALILLTVARPAFAYLDPSTASMVISAIVGLIATATLALKTYWYKLKSFFRKDKPAEVDARDASVQDTESSPDP